MPELPEVETSVRGIAPHIEQQTVHELVIRNASLRWPIPRKLPAQLAGHTVERVERRAKYILLRFAHGTAILHLGMSGSLRICGAGDAIRLHDHVDMVFRNGTILRFHDPRRFGCLLWTRDDPARHKLLKSLGPEPLQDGFDGEYLHRVSRKRSCSVKALIMNSHIVVGVGNIYASESLFLAGINPKRKAGSVSRERYNRLADAIRSTLTASIEQGGTTLRDFLNESGNPGYFAQRLFVYGKDGEACQHCSKPIRHFVQQQRSTYYCSNCQR